MNLRMTALDFSKDNEPRDQRLFDAAQAYCKREFGCEMNFLAYIRTWVVEVIDGEKLEVIGITTVWNTIDIPTFHVSLPSGTKEALKVAEEATNMMYSRLDWYLQDTGLRGRKTLIYVAPEKEALWHRFLRRVGGKPANRYEVEIR
jgi:hypothetical protein